MISPVLAGTGQIGAVLATGRKPASTSSWWLAGGVSAANAVAAYQPIGAASLAASYVNLANPGTYNAAPGVAPTCASGTGWGFAGAQYLTTGVVPNVGWSMIVRFSNISVFPNCIVGSLNASVERFHFFPRNGIDKRAYGYGGDAASNTGVVSGIMALAANDGYYNGYLDDTTIGQYSGGYAVFIGARNQIGTPMFYITGNIQAAAIYNTTLTAPQVLAISTAMAALTG